MTITHHNDIIQGSDEWLQLRCGILTASEMKLIITPANLKPASNDKERAHLYELAAQRITNYVEPHYISDDMLRGSMDEIEARNVYVEKYGDVEEVGFITNDKFGFTIGYSPDGLIGDDGAIECKSRRQKYQIETILADAMPSDYLIQVQTGLLVSERKWIDFVSYCGGLPMFIKRVYPDPVVQDAIITAAGSFEQRLLAAMEKYGAAIADTDKRLIPTERKIYVEQEMTI